MTLLVEPSGLSPQESAPVSVAVAEPGVRARRPAERRPTRLRTGGPLSLILLVQTLMWLKVQPSVSPQEALSLYTGHLDLMRMAAAMSGSATAAHAGATATHAFYLSGTGFLYPLIAGLSASIGGLAAARLVSLVLMLGATVLVCGFTRRLYGNLAGVVASALFMAASPTLFLGQLAQYDAVAIFALCLGARMAVSGLTRAGRKGIIAPGLAGAAAAFCALTGPAGLLFAPFIALIVIVATTGSPDGERSRLTRAASFSTGALVLGGICLGLLPLLDAGMRWSLFGWRPDTAYGSAWASAGSTLLDIGPALVLALIALGIAVAGRARVAGRTMGIAVTLGAGAVAALVYAIVLGDGPSLVELSGCSLVFATPLAGEAARHLFERFRGKAVIPILAGLLAVLSFAGATYTANFNWKSETRLVASLSKVVRAGGDTYLVAQPTVPQYYLAGQSLPRQFVSTVSFVYTAPSSHDRWEGRPAYVRAIRAGYFAAVALPSGGARGSINSFIRDAVVRSGKYRLLAHVDASRTQQGADVWILRVPVTTAGKSPGTA